MFCSNCGEQIPDDSVFCEQCGYALNEESSSAAPAVVKPVASYTAPITAQPMLKGKKGILYAVILLAVITVVTLLAVLLLNKEEPPISDRGQNSNYSDTRVFPFSRNDSSKPDGDENSTQPDPEQKPDTIDTEGIEGIEPADGEYITNQLSTNERPTLEEFSWYEDVFSNGLWSGSTPVTETPYMLGGWKCYIVYDPYKNMDSYAQELANANLSIGQSGAEMVIDWYQMYWEGEAPYDESGQEDTVYIGSFENGEFSLTGAGNITLSSFYEYNGTYYGFGSLLTPDGVIANLCLMR